MEVQSAYRRKHYKNALSLSLSLNYEVISPNLNSDIWEGLAIKVNGSCNRSVIIVNPPGTTRTKLASRGLGRYGHICPKGLIFE